MTDDNDVTSVVTARVVQALPLLYNLFVCAYVPHVARQSWRALQDGQRRGDTGASASQWLDVTAGGKRLLIALSASLWLGLAFVQLTAIVQEGDPKHGWFAVFVEPIRRALPFYLLFLLFCLTIRTAQGSLFVTLLRPEDFVLVDSSELWRFWYATGPSGVSIDIVGGAALTLVCVFSNSTSVIVLVGCSCAFLARRVLYSWHHSLGYTSFRFQVQVYACIMLALTLAMLTTLGLVFFIVWVFGLEDGETNKDKDANGNSTVGSDLVVTQWYSITWIATSTAAMVFPASLVAMTYRFEMRRHHSLLDVEEEREQHDDDDDDDDDNDAQSHPSPHCPTFQFALYVLVVIQLLGLFANFLVSPTFNAPAFPTTAREKGNNSSLLGFTFNVYAFLAYNVLLVAIPAHVGYTSKVTGGSFRQGFGALYAYKEIWTKALLDPALSSTPPVDADVAL